MDNSNRRRHQRAQVDPNILISNEFSLVDLSESGAQLSAIHPRKIGSTLQLCFEIEGETLNLRAIVRWCNQSHSIFSSNFNIGLQFEGVLINHTLLLRRYIAARLSDERQRA